VYQNKKKKLEAKKTYSRKNLRATGEKSKLRIGSVLQWRGSADPEPYQNVTDPEHCFKPLSRLSMQNVQSEH
jgi:hypothetical protein